MRKFFGIILILVGFFIAFLTVRGSVFFDTNDHGSAQEKLANLHNVKELSIASSSIGIDVRETDGEELIIVLEGKGAKQAELYSENRGEQLTIQAKYRQKMPFHFGFFSHATMVVHIPTSYDKAVSIKTSSGNVTISGDRLFSALKIVTSSGNVKKLAGSFSDFEFHSSSGSLATSKLLTKQARFTTSSGNVSVKEFQGDLEGKSSSGDAHIEFVNRNGDVRWSSSSGDIHLQIPDPSYTMELATSSGDFIIETPHQTLSQKKRYIHARVGEGDKQVNIKTSSGDVILK